MSVENRPITTDDDGPKHPPAISVAPALVDWRTIDGHVRQLAARRVALDAEEAEWLLAARRAQVHHHLGLGSFDEYLERILRYAPSTARDRMRVVAELEQLPLMRAALMQGELAFSAVRELSRVATPETERAWLTSTIGQSVREVEQRVRGRKRGDAPDASPRHDQARPGRRLTLSAEVYAVLLETRRHLERESGGQLTDADVIVAACRRVLAATVAPERSEATAGSSAPTPEPELASAAPCTVPAPAPATATDIARAAILALTGLGVSRRIATSAVARATRDAGCTATLEDVVASARRHCVQPTNRHTGRGHSSEPASGGARPVVRASHAAARPSGMGRSTQAEAARAATKRAARPGRAGRERPATRAVAARVQRPRARPRQAQPRRAGRARGRRRQIELRAERLGPRRERG